MRQHRAEFEYSEASLSCNRQRGRILWVRMFAGHGMGAPADVQSAEQEGRSMMGTVVFRVYRTGRRALLAA